MSIRETLQQKKGVGVAIAITFIVIAVTFIIREAGSGLPANRTSAYYSDDDGKTYFADDVNKISPFDHNGKPAVRAYVYKAAGGEPFVGYLERYTESAQKQMAALAGKTDALSLMTASALSINGTQVKRPGDTKWIPNAAAGNAVTTVKAPSGSGPVEGVYP